MAVGTGIVHVHASTVTQIVSYFLCSILIHCYCVLSLLHFPQCCHSSSWPIVSLLPTQGVVRSQGVVSNAILLIYNLEPPSFAA